MMALGLRDDVVDRVVGHDHLVRVGLVGVDLVGAGAPGEAIEIVVVEGLDTGPTELAGGRDGDLVFQAQDVAYVIVGVEEVLEGVAVAFAGFEVGEPTVVGVVGVAGADLVAELEEGALVEGVVFEGRLYRRWIVKER